MKVKDIIKQLQEYKDQDYQMVYDMFCEDDVREQAESMEVTLSDGQVTSVIRYLERNADATEGMNWDSIEDAIALITN